MIGSCLVPLLPRCGLFCGSSRLSTLILSVSIDFHIALLKLLALSAMKTHSGSRICLMTIWPIKDLARYICIYTNIKGFVHKTRYSSITETIALISGGSRNGPWGRGACLLQIYCEVVRKEWPLCSSPLDSPYNVFYKPPLIYVVSVTSA